MSNRQRLQFISLYARQALASLSVLKVAIVREPPSELLCPVSVLWPHSSPPYSLPAFSHSTNHTFGEKQSRLRANHRLMFTWENMCWGEPVVVASSPRGPKLRCCGLLPRFGIWLPPSRVTINTIVWRQACLQVTSNTVNGGTGFTLVKPPTGLYTVSHWNIS